MGELFRRLWCAVRRRRFEADLAAELDFHREMKEQEVVERGMSSKNAAFAVRRALGSAALAQDQSRDVWCPHGLQGLGQDFRLAVRSLRGTPVVAAVVVLSLALGIGANTAIFSLINSLLLRPLPVADPQRLVNLSAGPAGTDLALSYASFDRIREHRDLFESTLAFSGSLLTIDGDSEPVYNQWVSGEYFATLGVPARLGRTITMADDIAGGGPDGAVAMISDGLWQRQFGGAPSVVGTRLLINHVPVTIVGVVPRAFVGVEVGWAADLFMPIKLEPLIRPGIPYDDDTPWLRIMLRLKRGQSHEGATAALRAVQAQIREGSIPRTFITADFMKEPFHLETELSETSVLRHQFEQPLEMVLMVVGLVLLIASANLANLQLVRGTARRHELSVRVALGASRWRLARQLLAESIVLAAVGAVIGLVCAGWAARLIVAELATAEAPLALDLSLDTRVLLFTAVTMIASVVLFGFAPALRATRVAPMDALKARGPSGVGRARAPFSNSLVVVQVAVSLLLVVAAGLFIQTFARLTHVALGFDRTHMLTVTVAAPTNRDPRTGNQFYHQLVHIVARLPGVMGAGGSLNPPLTLSLSDYIVVTPLGADSRASAENMAQLINVTPGWLAAYGTPVRAGRDINDQDTATTQPVMLVNEVFVRRFFAGRNPIGTPFALTGRGPLGDFPVGTKTIVGVVGDAVYRSIREPVTPTIYMPLAQFDGPMGPRPLYIAVRPSSGSSTALRRNITAALIAIDPDLKLSFQALDDQVDRSLARDRLVATLSGLFGGLALLLAGLGLYGVTAYAVALRRQEIGIRMALGSTWTGVLRLVLSRVMLLVSLGVGIGVALSFLISRFVASLLYGLQPRDPATLIGAVVTILAVSSLAAGTPAYRASQIDPAMILRDQ